MHQSIICVRGEAESACLRTCYVGGCSRVMPPAYASPVPTSKLRSISISWVSPTEPPCSFTESHVTRWGSVCSRVAYQA